MTHEPLQHDPTQLSLIQQDSDNRERALALENFIVEAPAGAGKTELLTQRYLKLMAIVSAPEEIVALTFTNKAAAEMRNRILLSLVCAQNDTPPLSELANGLHKIAPHKLVTRQLALSALKHASNNGWQLLAQPARLRIQTMDALCSSLARQMPLLSRFGGQPNVVMDALNHYQNAAQLTLALVNDETDLDATISTALRFLHNDIEKLTKLLAQMLAKRDQWLPLAGEHANVNAEDIAVNINQALTELIEQRLDDILRAIPKSSQLQIMPLMRFAASNLAPDHAFEVLADWQTPLTASINDLSKWQLLADFFLTVSGTLRKTVNVNNGFPPNTDKKNPHFETFKQRFYEACELITDVNALDALRQLPSAVDETILQDSVITQAFAKLLQLATAQLWGCFQAANEVDFVAIAQSASYALENETGVTDLALKLDYKIMHLLVDEFQDTSPSQMRLISQLTTGWQSNYGRASYSNGDGRALHPNGDGRTLFCVGDPMQSIYRFRKADVSLFLQASEFGINQIPLTPLKLSRNNRSHPQVVNWINNTFKSVFPATDNIIQASISYRTFIATKPSIDNEGVNVHAMVLNSDEESDQAKLIEARKVADLITQELSDNPQDNIVVLVRSRSHLAELVSVIRRDYAHIRFQALDIERLNDRQTVLDALSLTRALLHRADRVHWLSILRAPWCGLTLKDMHALAFDNHSATIWQLMTDDVRVQTLSLDGQQRLMHVRTILSEAFAHQGRMPLRRWIESTWLKLGGPYTLISEGDNRDVQAFFDLVETTARGFVLDLDQLDASINKLYAEPDILATSQLQFLTIHAAKGLEFDTVILPALNRKPPNPDSPMMLWEDVAVGQHRHLLAAPVVRRIKGKPSLYEFLKSLETQRLDNETARLLYVAATRTIKRLHLVGTVIKTAKDELKPEPKSLLALLWSAVNDQFLVATPVASSKLTNAESSIRLQDFSPKLKRLKTPCMSESLNFNALTSNNYGENNAAQALKTAKLLDITSDTGTLAHLYMEMIALHGLSAWPAKRIMASKAAMQHWLKQKGHAENEITPNVKILINALTTTVSSADCAWLLETRESTKTEFGVTSVDAFKMAKDQRIDLTFVEPDEETGRPTRWIIDYKLTFFDQEKELTLSDLTVIAQQHRGQLSRYAGLFNHEDLPIKTAVFFIALGKMIKLNIKA